MARWMTIIAVLSIGLNIGLAAAVGFGLWQRSGHWERLEFRSFLKHDGDREGDRMGHRNRPNGLKGDRWAQQVVASCLPMIDAGADLSDACARVQNMLSTLPQDDLGRPILPRRGDGKLDMKEFFEHAGPGPMGLSHPARPANLAELQAHLGLSDVQRESFRSLLRDQGNTRRSLNQNLFTQKQALEAYLERSDFDANQALKLYQGTLALRNRSLEEHAMRFLRLYESLDNTQRALLLDWTNDRILSLLE